MVNLLLASVPTTACHSGGAHGTTRDAGGSGGSSSVDSGLDAASGRSSDGGVLDAGNTGGTPAQLDASSSGGAGAYTDARSDATSGGGTGGATGAGGAGTGGATLDGGVVGGYRQAQDGSGVLTQSSGNGNDYDQFVWDDFTVTKEQSIVEVRWEGGYLLPPTYPSGPIQSFDVSFWTTVANQPDIGAGPTMLFEALTASETSLGTFGGKELFEYSVQLPSAVHLVANQRYWVEIGAFQPGVPGWGIASGTAGNGVIFQSFVNYAGGTAYRFGTGDAAFTLTAGP